MLLRIRGSTLLIAISAFLLERSVSDSDKTWRQGSYPRLHCKGFRRVEEWRLQGEALKDPEDRTEGTVARGPGVASAVSNEMRAWWWFVHY